MSVYRFGNVEKAFYHLKERNTLFNFFMTNPVEIFKFSKEKLLEIFVEKSPAPKEMVSGKNHWEYFSKYLINKDIQVETIVVENDYIDRDFLEDFSAYYVRCFTDYERKCTRVHFFKNKFSPEKFESFLEKFDPDFKNDLEENYIGFIVIKPLPQTIIGRSCLKTYSEKTESGDTRVYPITRKYEVNLCGIQLSVKSIAFQEQDTVVSACATSALWSAFQGTGVLFHHKILSPVEITKTATKQFPLKERPFPNRGLNVEQMMHAVQESDMEPFLVNIENDEFILKNYIYSYLTYGIPIILGVDLYDTSQNSRYLGSHAVVVTGYRLENETTASHCSDRLCVTAANMSKIYVHDDQVGPFSKMKMDGIEVVKKEGNKETKHFSLSTEGKFNNTPVEYVRAVPLLLLIPLYHKIRIPLERIVETIEIFRLGLDILIENGILDVEKFQWDVFLSSVNDFKKEILSQSGKNGNFKNILYKKLPRFLWRAKAFCKDEPVMEFLFDATDIEQGVLFRCGAVYNQKIYSALRVVIPNNNFICSILMQHNAGKSILDFFKNQP